MPEGFAIADIAVAGEEAGIAAETVGAVGAAGTATAAGTGLAATYGTEAGAVGIGSAATAGAENLGPSAAQNIGTNTDLAVAGQENLGPAAAQQAGSGGGFWNTLTQAFQKNGAIGTMFGKGGAGMGIAQVLSSLYGLEQSKKLQSQSAPKGATQAGMDAVTRGMAAQGYQGSGNMMAALERYGAETNLGNPQGQQAALMGQLSSLGLLTSGLPQLFGWGSTPSGTGSGTGGP